ncbi:hypothetical protein [Aliihoeflea sp. PC F10.4]
MVQEDFRARAARILADVLHHDAARPIEWLSLLALLGWLQFLLTQPEEFSLPRYAAFSALPPNGWAWIIGGIVTVQLLAFWPSRLAGTLRFIAMALAAGIWTTIAISFWSSVSTAPISARTNTVIAMAVFVTAIHLGLRRQE